LRHDLLELLLLLLVPEAVLLPVIALIAGVVLVGVVVLVRVVELLPLWAVDDEVGVTTLEIAPLVISSSPCETCARRGTFSPAG
jgi:hypothetical protein